MANLDRSFDVVGQLNQQSQNQIKSVLTKLEGVNHVQFDTGDNKIIVGYTPGIVNVQILKETIENQGVDISDRGDD
ncbi:MAG TPA: hypothetical protein VEC37_03330 [Bacillota bacterium]|nr:hypothetical protein [Bacillota bacterium]